MNKEIIVRATCGIIFAGVCLALPAVLNAPKDYVSLSNEDSLSISQLSQKDPSYSNSNGLNEESKSGRSKYLSDVREVLSQAVSESISYMEQSIIQTQGINRYYDKLTKCLSRGNGSTTLKQQDFDNVMVMRAKLIFDLFTLQKVREGLGKIEIPTDVEDTGQVYEDVDNRLNFENDRYNKIIFKDSNEGFFKSLKALADKLRNDDSITDSTHACSFKKDTIKLTDEYQVIFEKHKEQIANSKNLSESKKLLKPVTIIEY